MRRFSLSLLLGLFVLQYLAAQSIVLDDYLARLERQNLNAQELQLKVSKQVSKRDQAGTLWNPTVDSKVSYLFALGGREIIFPVGDLFNPTYGALNQLLGSQEFPTDLENNRIQLTPNNFLDANISVAKPLINSSIKYNQKIQSALIGLAEIDVSITLNNLRLQLRRAYYNHLKTYTAISIIDQNMSLLNEVLDFNKKLVEYDKATDEAVSDVEYQIANLMSQKAEVVAQQQVTKALINILINEDISDEISIDTLIVSTVNRLTLLENDLLSIAKQGRAEYTKFEQAQSIILLNQELIQKEKQPTLGIQGGIGVQSEEFSFDTGGPLYTLGVGLNINILDGGLRKKKIEELSVDRSILENQQAQLDQGITIAIIQAQAGLRSLQSKIEADSAALRSAQRSYDLVGIRYQNEKALLIELLQAQTRVATSQINLAITKYDMLIKSAELDHALGR